jgi:histidinol-phosphate aminotransferase
MISRRGFGKSLGILASAPIAAAMTESAMAQRALVGAAPEGTVWLNANEHPDGPCIASMVAMSQVLGLSGRYHYQEFPEFYGVVARSEQLEANQVLVGSGSSEILHTAIDAFTSPTRPLILSEPTYEFPGEVVRAAGHPVVGVPLRKDYSADVKRIAEEAAKAKGGLIYLCNPNNPTSSITSKDDVAWLTSNLPAGVVLMVDEAYIHFSDSPKLESAMRFVRDGKDVVVTRTFSKIYGMAGLRVGFGCAKPDLIAKMAPYRNNVISYISAKATVAALRDTALLPQRKKQMAATRGELCEWLTNKNLKFIEPHANFMMIEVGRDAREFIPKMLAEGVAIGRRFPDLSNMIRVTIGTDAEMAKFQKAFWKVLQAAG